MRTRGTRSIEQTRVLPQMWRVGGLHRADEAVGRLLRTQPVDGFSSRFGGKEAAQAWRKPVPDTLVCEGAWPDMSLSRSTFALVARHLMVVLASICAFSLVASSAASHPVGAQPEAQKSPPSASGAPSSLKADSSGAPVTSPTGTADRSGGAMDPVQPTHWLAYAQWVPVSPQPLEAVLRSAPDLVLYRDGRLVWRDAMRAVARDRQDPDAWRTAVLSERERIDLRLLAIDSEFYTIALPARTEGVDISGSVSVRVGLQLGGVREIVLRSRYAPESAGSRRWVVRMGEVIDGLRVLTQRVSDAYRPTSIRLRAVPAEADAAAAAWDLPLGSTLASGHAVIYEGEEARRAVDMLGKSNIVTLEGRPYRVGWAPVLDAPTVVVTPSTPTR